MDLWGLNNFIPYGKFRMTTLSSIPPWIKKGDWMAILYLKDLLSYHKTCQVAEVPLVRHQKSHYQYMVLGLCLAPALRVFTRIMVVIAAHLCLQRLVHI